MYSATPHAKYRSQWLETQAILYVKYLNPDNTVKTQHQYK